MSEAVKIIPAEFQGIPAGEEAVAPENVIPIGVMEVTTITSNTGWVHFGEDESGSQWAVKEVNAIEGEGEHGYLDFIGRKAQWALGAEIMKMRRQPMGIKTHQGLVGLSSAGKKRIELVHVNKMVSEDRFASQMVNLGDSNNLHRIITPDSWNDRQEVSRFSANLLDQEGVLLGLLDSHAAAIEMMRESVPNEVPKESQPGALASGKAYLASIMGGNLPLMEYLKEARVDNFVIAYQKGVEVIAEKLDGLFRSREDNIAWCHGDPAVENSFRASEVGFDKSAVLTDPIAFVLKETGNLAPWAFADNIKEIAAATSELLAYGELASTAGDETLADFYVNTLRQSLLDSFSYHSVVTFNGDLELLLDVYEAYWGQVRAEIKLREGKDELEKGVSDGRLLIAQNKIAEGFALMNVAESKLVRVLDSI